MSRDYGVFPDDENGDVLWRMFLSGDNLGRPREIDFWMIFKDGKLAMEFAILALKNGWKVSFAEKNQDDFPWQTGVHVVLLPEHSKVTEFERQLSNLASEFGGVNDGWGCIQVES